MLGLNAQFSTSSVFYVHWSCLKNRTYLLMLFELYFVISIAMKNWSRIFGVKFKDIYDLSSLVGQISISLGN